MKSSDGGTNLGLGEQNHYLAEQNHYEVLEVNRGARLEEIEQAYRMATSTWTEGSLALYSLFDDRDATLVRERITSAYRILSDEAARRSYDVHVFGEVPEPEEKASPPAALEHEKQLDSELFDEMDSALESTLEDGVEQLDTFDGPLLRRLRMQRGFEISDIAGVTKVSSRYLVSIEDEDFDALPAAVYTRGFVTAYARTIGLDPQQVAASYMPRFEAARQGKSRGRSLGRH